MMREADISVTDNGVSPVVVVACCTALATLVPVALYQTGVIGSLPDPPSDVFDSEKITMSKAAHPLGVPDALLGLGSFGVTLTLALLSRRSPVAKRLLGFKLTADAGAAGFNAVRQVVSFGKLCSWCTGTALAAGVMAYAGREVMAESWGEAALCAKAGFERVEKRLG